jgi:hypothetical protein
MNLRTYGTSDLCNFGLVDPFPRLSDLWAFGLMDFRNCGPSELWIIFKDDFSFVVLWTFGLVDLQTCGPSDLWTFGLMDRHQIVHNHNMI